ncbi:MAG TPA: 4-alpha-glucanotransferase [Streptosporangiaceae bacterium]|nr:4-alpha-glucanotransferase [Streptosporangiaceae bacterium]
MPEYRNWQGRRVTVPAETLAAILEVLERPQPATAGSESGPPGGRLAPAAPRLELPATRQWGFTVQLYSVRSAASWGHGDLHDLAELARWSATAQGAGFLLVNPLHAAEPVAPVSASPYLPMTRLFVSPLYLRVEDVAEYGALPPAARRRIAELAAPLRAASATADLIDRDAVWRAKRAALELVRTVALAPQREAAYTRFRADRGRDLACWSAWCALAERHGPDWRCWPAELADPDRACAAVGRDPALRLAADFHAWLQWQADEQLTAAQAAAKDAGMAHGIIHDLAVGVHPGGADAWAHQRELVAGFSVGAPPDGFNQLGQDWGQPPWSPRALAAAGYRPLAELFAASLRHAGGIRVDHVMGLMRLWWVPAGQRPDRGAYVRYDHRASVAALVGAVAAARGVGIGEDLGTVEPWIRRYLAAHHLLGTEMLWFARDRSGRPLPPERWRRACMATVGTHDVPTVAGFRTGDQVTVRARLGLLANPEDRERADSDRLLARWYAALAANGLLPAGSAPDTAQLTVALYGYLHKTPALLVGVALADAVGEVRTQNIPGTTDEYPNWRIPLGDDHGRAVLLEDLPDSGLLRQVCRAVRGG